MTHETRDLPRDVFDLQRAGARQRSNNVLVQPANTNGQPASIKRGRR